MTERHDDIDLVLTGTRMFGRIRAFDIACPRCDQMYMVGQGTKSMKVWNWRTARFTCLNGCGLRLNLGILAWNVALGPSGAPADISPLDWKQALALRNLFRGQFIEKRIKRRHDQNRVIGGSCGCLRIEPDPGCPLHGRLR